MQLDKSEKNKKDKEIKKTYKDPQQTFGRPKKHTDLEQYAIYREWQDRGDKRIEQIAIDHKIAMSTLRKYIAKYKNQNKQK